MSDEVGRGVLQATVSRVEGFVTGNIAPLLAEQSDEGGVAPESVAALDTLLRSQQAENRLATVKIWTSHGRIIYSTRKDVVGQSVRINDVMRRAWQGKAQGEFDDLEDAENEHERLYNRPLFEVYVPIKKAGTSQTIAVAEIYEFGDDLAAELRNSRLRTFLIVGHFGLLMFLAHYRIVRDGCRMISRQQASLSTQVNTLSELLDANKGLRLEITEANRRAGETAEAFLRRIGADLHDGPAQLLGYALLRLNMIENRLEPSLAEAEVAEMQQLRSAIADALHELRAICANVALPELRDVTLSETMRMAVRSHERRTGSKVTMDVSSEMPEHLPEAIIVTLYRFLQEGLNNAFRHAEGKGQGVSGRCVNDMIELTVSDNGNGIGDTGGSPDGMTGLGLRGLRERIRAVGGEFNLKSIAGQGTQLSVRFPMPQVGVQYVDTNSNSDRR